MVVVVVVSLLLCSYLLLVHLLVSTITHTHTHNCLTALCMGLPGWASNRRNIHPLTPILIVKHPLSTSSIYHDP